MEVEENDFLFLDKHLIKNDHFDWALVLPRKNSTFQKGYTTCNWIAGLCPQRKQCASCIWGMYAVCSVLTGLLPPSL